MCVQSLQLKKVKGSERKKKVFGEGPKYLFLYTKQFKGWSAKNHSHLFDHETILQIVDPLHLDGIVLGDVSADVNADFARLTAVHRNVGGFIFLAVVDAVRLGAIGRAQVAVGT